MLLEVYKELRVIMDDYITGPGGVINMSQVLSVVDNSVYVCLVYVIWVHVIY